MQGTIPSFIGKFYHYISKVGPKDPLNYKKLRSFLYQAAAGDDAISQDDLEACSSQHSLHSKESNRKSINEQQPGTEKKRSREEDEVLQSQVLESKKIKLDPAPGHHVALLESQPEE